MLMAERPATAGLCLYTARSPASHDTPVGAMIHATIRRMGSPLTAATTRAGLARQHFPRRSHGRRQNFRRVLLAAVRQDPL